jgi:outer membrane immunogenic protein
MKLTLMKPTLKKQTLLAGIAVSALALAGAAHAADLPMPTKAPMASPAFSWTGCYAGGHVGWGWSRNSFQDAPGGPTSSNIDLARLFRTVTINSNGAVYGGQLGCDYQVQGPWVVGIQGSAAGANINGGAPDPFGTVAGVGLAANTDFLADVTGRIGYAWGNVLLYGKGGAAWADERYNFTFVGGAAPGQVSLFGGVAGAGFEWNFAQNWSAVVEYDHYFFGAKVTPLNFVGLAPPLPLAKLGEDIDVVKVGMNYRFDLWSPVARR